MATVYLATDLKHERLVALKILKPELAAVLGADRFLREIKTTAQLTHPHILLLLDSGDAEGTLFYVMSYVEGESLRDRLNREKQLPLDDAFRLANEVNVAKGSMAEPIRRFRRFLETAAQRGAYQRRVWPGHQKRTASHGEGGGAENNDQRLRREGQWSWNIYFTNQDCLLFFRS